MYVFKLWIWRELNFNNKNPYYVRTVSFSFHLSTWCTVPVPVPAASSRPNWPAGPTSPHLISFSACRPHHTPASQQHDSVSTVRRHRKNDAQPGRHAEGRNSWQQLRRATAQAEAAATRFALLAVGQSSDRLGMHYLSNVQREAMGFGSEGIQCLPAGLCHAGRDGWRDGVMQSKRETLSTGRMQNFLRQGRRHALHHCMLPCLDLETEWTAYFQACMAMATRTSQRTNSLCLDWMAGNACVWGDDDDFELLGSGRSNIAFRPKQRIAQNIQILRIIGDTTLIRMTPPDQVIDPLFVSFQCFWIPGLRRRNFRFHMTLRNRNVKKKIPAFGTGMTWRRNGDRNNGKESKRGGSRRGCVTCRRACCYPDCDDVHPLLKVQWIWFFSLSLVFTHKEWIG